MDNEHNFNLLKYLYVYKNMNAIAIEHIYFSFVSTLVKENDALPKRQRKSTDDLFDDITVNERNQEFSVGMYAKHLVGWLKFFKIEQIHIVDGDQLAERPWEVSAVYSMCTNTNTKCAI